MKNMMHLLATLGVLSLLAISAGKSVFAQTDIAKAIQEKLAAEAAKLENSCADDIKKFCSDVTPGEGRILYCMPRPRRQDKRQMRLRSGGSRDGRATFRGSSQGGNRRL